MTERPQVLSLTAGARTIHLDTRTVARALRAIRVSIFTPDWDMDALTELTNTLRDLCGPDHLAAVLRDDGTTTDTE